VAAAAVCSALALSGCDQVRKLAGGGGAPTGQVVATVDGEEITSLQLRAELGNFGSRDPAVMKAAQQQALQRIILRKLLAKEAREEKLDKGSDYTIQVERGQETLLAQLYQRKLASKVTPATKAEAEAFVAANPARFSQRKVLFVDQVIAAPNKIEPERLRPLKTLDEVKAMLDAEGVQYQANAVVLDTLTANPQLVEGVNNLPPGEVFVIPQGGGTLVFNHVNASRAVPFTGELATNYAMNILRQQKAQETVAKQVEALRKAAEPKIQYNDAFKPPPPKKAGAPAAKAPAGAAPAAPAAAPAVPPADAGTPPAPEAK
jgi:EpsD family peptidyl-prolyl cis-trans isomerase